jgi:hypothetical protein
MFHARVRLRNLLPTLAGGLAEGRGTAPKPQEDIQDDEHH